MSTKRIKSDSLSCRVSSEHKQLIERAARLSGFSLSDFITRVLVSTAAEIVREATVIQLTKSEWDSFTTSLDRPAKVPGKAARDAIELFKQGHDDGDEQVW